MKIEVFAVDGIPEVAAGDDLGELIADAAAAGDGAGRPRDGDIVVVAQKVVSKAEGRVVPLTAVEAGAEAQRLAGLTGKDPRVAQAILDESRTVLRAAPGVLIVETRHGFVCANAGIDRSNLPAEDALLLLPVDPDASARRLRAALRERLSVNVGVIVTDSFGRAWRVGQVDTAIGCAGLEPVLDLRGQADGEGREMTATIDCVADALAAAANLARGKRSREPVVIIRGRGDVVGEADGPGARAVIRDRDLDLFR